MKHYMAWIVFAVVAYFGGTYLYSQRANCTLCQTIMAKFSGTNAANAQPSSMAGLEYNPYQDLLNGESLSGSSQETVDPLTGELILQPSSILSELNQPQAIGGTATGTSTVT